MESSRVVMKAMLMGTLSGDCPAESRGEMSGVGLLGSSERGGLPSGCVEVDAGVHAVVVADDRCSRFK